jgi:hypothetical protein
MIGCVAGHAQSLDSLSARITHFPGHFLDKTQARVSSLETKLTSQTQSYLQKIMKQEQRLMKRLEVIDPASARQLFAGVPQQYAAWMQTLKSTAGKPGMALSGPYQPYTDSLQKTLAFLQTNPQLIAGRTSGSAGAVGAGGSITGSQQAKIQAATESLQSLQAKMQAAGQINQYLAQRKAQIGDYLRRYTSLPAGIKTTYDAYRQRVYYYKAQMDAYKAMLNDPDKLFQTALGLLNRVPAFSSYMQSHSSLLGAFQLPGGSVPGSSAAVGIKGGLAGREQMLSLIQQQMGTKGPNATTVTGQQIGDAQGQVDALRSKLSQGGGDPTMPDFQPNGQKTKSLLGRLEYGVNLQTVSSTFGFPITSDLGFSLGYKLNDGNVAGIGLSYKIGWGSDIRHIDVTSQGVGLRSFLDIKIKGCWFASGGFEYNYQQPFYGLLKGLPSLDDWRKSGLIGVSRIVKINKGMLKKVKLQLLWDALSYQQVPPGTPFLFRIGYSF